METVVNLDFTKKINPLESIFAKHAKQTPNAKAFAYHMYDIVDNYEVHFFENIKSAKHEISEFNQKEFQKEINMLKKFVGTCLTRLHDANQGPAQHIKQVNEWVLEDLKVFSKVDIFNVYEYLDTIGIPFTDTKVIKINNYLGLKVNQ